MAKGIVNCRICGTEVSEYAPACPKCGDAVAKRFGNEPRKSTNPWMVIGWIILAILVLPIATCIGVIATSEYSDTQDRAEQSAG